MADQQKGLGERVGNEAHDAVDSGNPIKSGGRARTTAITPVATDDRVDAIYSTTGGALIAGEDGGVPTDISVTTSGHVDVAVDAVAASPIPFAITNTSDTLVKAGDAVNDAIRVNLVAGGGSGGTSQTDNAAFTGGSTGVTPMGAIFDATPPTIADGSVGAPRMSSTRILLTEPEGGVAHDAPDAGNPIKVGGRAVTTVPAAVATNDRVDALYSTTGGALIAGVDGTTLRNIAVSGSGRLEIDIAAQQLAALTIGGFVPHDDPDDGAFGWPVKTGGRARTTLDTAVAVNDITDSIYSTTGGALIAGVDSTTVRNLAVNASGQIEVDISAQQGSAVLMQGDVAHDDADSGNPLSTGLNAAEFNADPPQVDADGDRVRAIATPQGIQWTLGGHPNIIRREYMTTAAQTNDPVIDSIAAGSQIIITAISVMVSAATSVTPQVRIGFGTTNPPTEPTSGNTVDDMLISHPGIAAGSGVVEGNGSAAIAVGGDGNELRIANDVPTGGQITVMVSYYISTL
jgi:hypothetical protein